MKYMFLFAAAAAFAVASAAQADPFAGAYGNTINVTQPDGSKGTAYFNPDKTFEEHRDGKVIKGTFEVNGDTVCKNILDPVPTNPGMAKICSKAADHKVGDTWTEATPDGKTITLSITAGR